MIYRKTAAVLLLFAAVIAYAADSPKLSADQNSALEDVRAYALQYARQLPNFICTQITRRETWRNNHFSMTTNIVTVKRDIIEEQLTFLDGKESYKVLTLNGKPATGLDHMKIGGAISWGEFGTVLTQVFAPDSHTTFTWDRETSVGSRRAWAFKFRVPREAGAAVVDRESNTAIVAPFSGRAFIDPETFAVIEISTNLELHKSFPIRNVERKILYAEQKIAGKSYNLPIHCEIHMHKGSLEFDNSIDFQNYHRFASESTIHVGDSVQE